MNLSQLISDFDIELKNKIDSQRSQFIIDFISNNSKYFSYILTNVILKTKKEEDLHVIINNDDMRKLLIENKIEKNLYYQDFYVIKIFNDAKLYDINKYTSILINRSFDEENIEFINYIINNLNEPYEFKDNSSFITPIADCNKELLSIIFNSDKIILSSSFLSVLISLVEFDNLPMLSWLISFDKIFNLCTPKWINSIQNEKNKKVIKTMVSIKNF